MLQSNEKRPSPDLIVKQKREKDIFNEIFLSATQEVKKLASKLIDSKLLDFNEKKRINLTRKEKTGAATNHRK